MKVEFYVERDKSLSTPANSNLFGWRLFIESMFVNWIQNGIRIIWIIR